MLSWKSLMFAGMLILLLSVPGNAQKRFFFGPERFIGLDDAPPEKSYDGQTGKGIVVNGTEDSFIFSSIGGSGSFDVDSIVTASGDVVVASGNVVTMSGG